MVLDPTDRRLVRAHTIADLRRIARRRSPRPVFDHVDGGAEQEISILRAREAYAAVEFSPRVLRDVSEVDLACTVLGRRAELPLVLAPTGSTRMMNHEGEIAVARAAARAGIPDALSTMGTTSIEDVRQRSGARPVVPAVPVEGPRASAALIGRAAQSGYEALVLTGTRADGGAPVGGARNPEAAKGPSPIFPERPLSCGFPLSG